MGSKILNPDGIEEIRDATQRWRIRWDHRGQATYGTHSVDYESADAAEKVCARLRELDTLGFTYTVVLDEDEVIEAPIVFPHPVAWWVAVWLGGLAFLLAVWGVYALLF